MLRHTRWFFDLVYAAPLPGLTFFNLGITPVPDHVRADPQGRREPHQAALYDLVSGYVPRKGFGNLPVAEISAGKGAGAAFLARRLSVTVLPFEPSLAGCFWARVRFRLRARRAFAEDTPLPDASVRAVVSVEAAHNYMTPAFAAEAWRLLAPGGVLILADFPLIAPDAQAREVPAWLEPVGFEIVHFEDLTARVIASCEADAPRKKRAFRFLPAPLRREALSAFSVDPSPRLTSFRDGTRGYYFAVARKPER